MIKVDIYGAENIKAGELIRILVNHPEIEFMNLYAPGMEGVPVSKVHHGLIGEMPLSFSSRPVSEKCDVVFICGDDMNAAEFMRLRAERPDLKIICLDPVEGIDNYSAGLVYALPEINRKLLVRGSTGAIIPAPAASAILIPLYPLGLEKMLEGDIDVRLTAPDDILEENAIKEAARQTETLLAETQPEFGNKIIITPRHAGKRRGLEAEIEIKCPAALEHVMDIYKIYDDHNFAFAVTHPVTHAETVGTDKCIFYVSKPDDETLLIKSTADCRMRGAAGEAVHVMNLLFGLHEKTGLYLKASDYPFA